MSEPGARAAPLASPLHAIVLAFPVALFPSALIADITYLRTEVVQWTNFAQWLIFGSLVFTGLLLAWALISFLMHRLRRFSAVYLALVAAMFVAGLLNALQHAKDGWASVGTLGLVLSFVCTLLGLAAAFVAHSRTQMTEKRA